MARKTSDTRRRTKVKNLSQDEQELTAKEAKKVKGGIIIINNQPAASSHNYKPVGGAIQDLLSNPAGLGQKGK